jgi:RNA-binding protein YlmH
MDIYQHFRKEEQPFIDQVLSLKDDVERTFQTKLTDFLDPREQFIMQSIIGGHTDVQLRFFGGQPHVERKRALLAPYYEEIHDEHFNVVILEASFPQKFVQLTHRDVLGSLMSLGMKRSKIGDLIAEDGVIQIVAAEEIAIFIQTHLQSVKKSKINLSIRGVSQLRESKERWYEQEGTVSSLRLDAIIKEIYRISRQQAQDYITKGAIKVNFRIVDNPSFQLAPGDMISFRKKGRSKIERIDGQTKKEKWRITTAMLK